MAHGTGLRPHQFADQHLFAEPRLFLRQLVQQGVGIQCWRLQHGIQPFQQARVARRDVLCPFPQGIGSGIPVDKLQTRQLRQLFLQVDITQGLRIFIVPTARVRNRHVKTAGDNHPRITAAVVDRLQHGMQHRKARRVEVGLALLARFQRNILLEIVEHH